MYPRIFYECAKVGLVIKKNVEFSSIFLIIGGKPAPFMIGTIGKKIRFDQCFRRFTPSLNVKNVKLAIKAVAIRYIAVL